MENESSFDDETKLIIDEIPQSTEMDQGNIPAQIENALLDEETPLMEVDKHEQPNTDNQNQTEQNQQNVAQNQTEQSQQNVVQVNENTKDEAMPTTAVVQPAAVVENGNVKTTQESKSAKGPNPQKEGFKPFIPTYELFLKDVFCKSYVYYPVDPAKLCNAVIQKFISQSESSKYRCHRKDEKVTGILEISFYTEDEAKMATIEIIETLGADAKFHQIFDFPEEKQIEFLGMKHEGAIAENPLNVRVVNNLPLDTTLEKLRAEFPEATRAYMGNLIPDAEFGYGYIVYTNNNEAFTCIRKYFKSKRKIGENKLYFYRLAGVDYPKPNVQQQQQKKRTSSQSGIGKDQPAKKIKQGGNQGNQKNAQQPNKPQGGQGASQPQNKSNGPAKKKTKRGGKKKSNNFDFKRTKGKPMKPLEQRNNQQGSRPPFGQSPRKYQPAGQQPPRKIPNQPPRRSQPEGQRPGKQQQTERPPREVNRLRGQQPQGRGPERGQSRGTGYLENRMQQDRGRNDQGMGQMGGKKKKGKKRNTNNYNSRPISQGFDDGPRGQPSYSPRRYQQAARRPSMGGIDQNNAMDLIAGLTTVLGVMKESTPGLPTDPMIPRRFPIQDGGYRGGYEEHKPQPVDNSYQHDYFREDSHRSSGYGYEPSGMSASYNTSMPTSSNTGMLASYNTGYGSSLEYRYGGKDYNQKQPQQQQQQSYNSRQPQPYESYDGYYNHQ